MTLSNTECQICGRVLVPDVALVDNAYSAKLHGYWNNCVCCPPCSESGRHIRHVYEQAYSLTDRIDRLNALDDDSVRIRDGLVKMIEARMKEMTQCLAILVRRAPKAPGMLRMVDRCERRFNGIANGMASALAGFAKRQGHRAGAMPKRPACLRGDEIDVADVGRGMA